MNNTQSLVLLEAVVNGFDGSWERLIAKALVTDVIAGHSEAEVILEATGGDYLKAAYLITSSEIPDNAKKIPL